jgi:hypothetical protein
VYLRKLKHGPEVASSRFGPSTADPSGPMEGKAVHCPIALAAQSGRCWQARVASGQLSTDGLVLLQKRGPVLNYCQRRGGRCSVRLGDDKPLAIGGGGVQIAATDGDASEESLSLAHFQSSRVRVDCGGHQIAVRRNVEKLLAVAPPKRSLPAAGRNLPLATWAGVRYPVDLAPSGFVRNIRDPFPVRRELTKGFVEWSLQ